MSLFLAAAVLVFAAPGEEPGHNHGPQLGKVSFATTCNAQADALVQRGLGWLHSFEYDPAAKSFSEAAAADPSCGIAHWGVAVSYYHPLWAPPTAAELEKANAALAKAKAAGAKSARERDYIAAIDTFYRGSDRLDHKTRAAAYSAALEQLHKRYPTDREAAVLYALSLIALGTMDKDPEFSKEKQAGAILNTVLAEAPDHPGVAHYLIHNFDYPPLAGLALAAARGYASIAPDSAHAQHMPSHIFTRLGLWEESIKSNIKSAASSVAYAKSVGLAGADKEQLHAMDYLAYAYLQMGQDADAQRVLDELNALKRADPPVFSVAYAATAIPARLTLERRQWREAAALKVRDNVLALAPLANFGWAEAHIHFARAIGAARSGDRTSARQEVATLRAIEDSLKIPPGTYDWKTQVAIERQIAEAWLAYADGRKDDSVRIMRAAADLDDATEKHPVTPGAILPAREQLGELLLELGRPAEALAEFEASLKRAPKRLAGVYGAARSARLAGDTVKAGPYYAELRELTKSSDGARAEVKEARSFRAETAAR